MSWLAAFKPFSYPYRNFVAIVTQGCQFFMFTSAMYWARPNAYCDMEFRKYVTPTIYAFTALTGL